MLNRGSLSAVDKLVRILSVATEDRRCSHAKAWCNEPGDEVWVYLSIVIQAI